MKISYFPACCTLKILCEFGGTETCDHEYKRDKPEQTVEEMIEEIEEWEKLAKENGEACLVATTNNEQKVANEALEISGFQSTGWMSKCKEGWTVVKMWWKPLNEEIPNYMVNGITTMKADWEEAEAAATRNTAAATVWRAKDNE
jgi:hypothetical protein